MSNIEVKDDFLPNEKIKQHAYDAISSVLSSIKEILLENLKKSFYSGEGICGANSTMKVDGMALAPDEIDFMNMLTVDPNSNVGKILYGIKDVNLNKINIDRKLFDLFSGGTYSFISSNQNQLFNINFNYALQEFRVSGLTQNMSDITVNEFLNDYFSKIELPNLTGVTMISMLSTIMGDSSETLKFSRSFNEVDRLLKKLCSLCGSPKNRNNIQNQTDNLFDETDEDLDYYFDFDNLDGVDLEDEENRYNKVLKFADCNNFEVPVNTTMIEDFVYQIEKKPLNDTINNALNRVASDAFNKSDGSIPIENFKLSLEFKFISSLPKSLATSVVKPNLFLPLIVIYKTFTSQANVKLNLKDTIKKLKKLFTLLIKDIFWKFIREFWKRIKSELIAFVRKLVVHIIKTKLKRQATILTSLIAVFKKYNLKNMNNCNELFGTIQSTINKGLSAKINLKIPSPLLAFSDRLEGFSKEKALMRGIQILASKGVDVSPINGVEPNNIIKILESGINATIDTMDAEGFVSTTNNLPIVLASPLGPVVIPPFVLNTVGKNM